MADSIYKYINSLPDKRVVVALTKVFQRFIPNATEFTNASLVDLGAVEATAAELNRVADVSTRIVSTTAATISVTVASHDSKTVVLASTHTQTLTLPTASGSGARYKFIVSATGTDGSKVIKVGSTLDNMTGVCIANCTSTDAANGFLTTATDDTITLNNTTTGGIKGTVIVIEDVATNLYSVKAENAMSGAIATPFSATV